MITSAESKYNLNGLLLLTEDTPVNSEYDSWGHHHTNVHYKIVAHARAWEWKGPFGDVCHDWHKVTCINCNTLLFNPATVSEIQLPGMYYPARHSNQVFSDSTLLKDYTSRWGANSNKSDWWGGYTYNPTC